MKIVSFLVAIWLQIVCVFAQNCLPAWRFYQPVTLTNPTATPLTDFQARIDLPVSALVQAGKLRPDGADLRVVDDQCNALAFYVDSSFSASQVTIWVKVPQLAANASRTLRIYYGRTQATAEANGDQTFVFFDDFNAPAVDLAKWEAVGRYEVWKQENGYMEFASHSSNNPTRRYKYVRSKQKFSGPVVLDIGIRHDNLGGFGFCAEAPSLDRFMFQYASSFDTLSQIGINQDTIDSGYTFFQTWPWLHAPRDNENHFTLWMRTNGSQHLVLDSILNRQTGQKVKTTLEFSSFDLPSYSLMFTSAAAPWPVYINYVKVRKPGAQPSVTFGTEVAQNPNSLEGLTAAGIRIYPNPGVGVFEVSATARIREWRIFNLQGQQIAMYDGSTTVLDLSAHPAGLYLVQASLPDGQQVSGLIEKQ